MFDILTDNYCRLQRIHFKTFHSGRRKLLRILPFPFQWLKTDRAFYAAYSGFKGTS